MAGASSADAGPATPTVYDHLRPADDSTDHDLPAGVYRVVGTAPGAVTLLRVADADGRRVHTGRVHTVAREDLTAFEPADDPDANRSLRAALASKVDALYWETRLLGRTVVARPVPSAVALALVAVGLFGDPIVAIPDLGDAVLTVTGALSLVYLMRHSST